MGMDKEKIAYTAGFFDGEGYVGLGFRERIEIRIVQTDKLVLEQLQHWWGGNIYIHTKKSKIRKTAYVWILLEREKVNTFIESIYPYLKVKKQQIDRCFDILTHKTTKEIYKI